MSSSASTKTGTRTTAFVASIYWEGKIAVLATKNNRRAALTAAARIARDDLHLYHISYAALAQGQRSSVTWQ